MADPVRSCFLVRHAIAEERGDAWPDDDERPLSKEGIRRMRRAVEGLAAIDVTIDHVVTSPLVRAEQTASILAKGLPNHPSISSLDALAPGGNPKKTVAMLAALGEHRRLALVGHEPDMGELAAYLLGLPEALPFRKGAICRIDFERWPPKPPGTLIWFATPKILRNLGGLE